MYAFTHCKWMFLCGIIHLFLYIALCNYFYGHLNAIQKV